MADNNKITDNEKQSLTKLNDMLSFFERKTYTEDELVEMKQQSHLLKSKYFLIILTLVETGKIEIDRSDLSIIYTLKNPIPYNLNGQDTSLKQIKITELTVSQTMQVNKMTNQQDANVEMIKCAMKGVGKEMFEGEKTKLLEKMSTTDYVRLSNIYGMFMSD